MIVLKVYREVIYPCYNDIRSSGTGDGCVRNLRVTAREEEYSAEIVDVMSKGHDYERCGLSKDKGQGYLLEGLKSCCAVHP